MSIFVWGATALIIFLLASEPTRKWLKKTSITVANRGSLPSNFPWKFILLGGVLLLFFMFWSDIRDFVANWFSQTDMNQQLQLEAETISRWFWLIVFSIIAGLFLISKRSGTKPKVRAYASTGIGGSVENIFGSVIILGGIVVYAFLILGALLIALGIADAVTGGKVQGTIDTAVAVARGEPLPKRAHRGAECDFKEKLDARRGRIDEEWIAVTICKDDEPFLFFVPSGTEPEIEYRDKTDRVLDSRPIGDFVQWEATWGQPGGMPDLYRLFIPDHPNDRFNGFKAAFLDSVTFEIRAYRK